ncbi:MAG: phosphatidylglycerophosphatase A [bacterium]
MAIKESSDELNPPEVADEAVLAAPRAARSLKDYIALAIATCGVGYLPLAPGTWGSLVGIGLFVLLRDFLIWLIAQYERSKQWNLLQQAAGIVTLEISAIVCLALIGIWAGSRTEKLSGKKDPGKIVIDEVAGQMIALVPVSVAVAYGGMWWPTILAFLLFRFFDIVKPYPARKFESLKGGWGIMADDLVAGIYAAVIVAVIVALRWFA